MLFFISGSFIYPLSNFFHIQAIRPSAPAIVEAENNDVAKASYYYVTKIADNIKMANSIDVNDVSPQVEGNGLNTLPQPQP